MNRIMTFMLFDFRLQPAWVRIFGILFLIGAALLVMFPFAGTRKPHAVEIFSLSFGLIFTVMRFTRPIVVTEIGQLETLHATLPLTRGDIVKAKYLYTICILVLIIFVPALFAPVFYPNNEKAYSFIAGAFMAASFFTSIIYPFYFKPGRVSIVLDRLIVPVSLILNPAILYPGFFEGKLGLFTMYARLIPATPTGKLAAGLIFLYLSYLLSLRIYRTLDL